eukprot:15483075-Alexandrium_andersonii.AAC.1
MVEGIPDLARQLITQEKFKGGPIVRFKGRACKQKDCVANEVWIRPALLLTPDRVPTAYFLADVFLRADQILEGKLLKLPGGVVASEKQKAAMALQEGSRLKAACGYMRYLARDTSGSSNEVIRRLKALVKKRSGPSASTETLESDDPATDDPPMPLTDDPPMPLTDDPLATTVTDEEHHGRDPDGHILIPNELHDALDNHCPPQTHETVDLVSETGSDDGRQQLVASMDSFGDLDDLDIDDDISTYLQTQHDLDDEDDEDDEGEEGQGGHNEQEAQEAQEAEDSANRVLLDMLDMDDNPANMPVDLEPDEPHDLHEVLSTISAAEGAEQSMLEIQEMTARSNPLPEPRKPEYPER